MLGSKCLFLYTVFGPSQQDSQNGDHESQMYVCGMTLCSER